MIFKAKESHPKISGTFQMPRCSWEEFSQISAICAKGVTLRRLYGGDFNRWTQNPLTVAFPAIKNFSLFLCFKIVVMSCPHLGQNSAQA